MNKDYTTTQDFRDQRDEVRPGAPVPVEEPASKHEAMWHELQNLKNVREHALELQHKICNGQGQGILAKGSETVSTEPIIPPLKEVMVETMEALAYFNKEMHAILEDIDRALFVHE